MKCVWELTCSIRWAWNQTRHPWALCYNVIHSETTFPGRLNIKTWFVNYIKLAQAVYLAIRPASSAVLAFPELCFNSGLLILGRNIVLGSPSARRRLHCLKRYERIRERRFWRNSACFELCCHGALANQPDDNVPASMMASLDPMQPAPVAVSGSGEW